VGRNYPQFLAMVPGRGAAPAVAESGISS